MPRRSIFDEVKDTYKPQHKSKLACNLPSMSIFGEANAGIGQNTEPAPQLFVRTGVNI